MPLTSLAAEAIGVVIIVLFAVFTTFGAFCIAQSVHFWLRTRRAGSLPNLAYFNGPWVTRITLVLISIWWGLGEVFRSSFLKARLTSSSTWQGNVCKGYIVSNLGFAEPCMLFMVILLLRWSLQMRESGGAATRGNRKMILCTFLMCIPVLAVEALLVFVAPKLVKEEISNRQAPKIAKYLRTSYPGSSARICTYPLFGTIFLGLVNVLLMCFMTYIGLRVLATAINKGLRKRVSWLMMAVLFCLPVRVLLLGFSVLPQPGDTIFELAVFFSFLMLLSCATVGVVVLVYCPVADSLALKDAGQNSEMIEMVPFDDFYYDGGSSLIANQSFRDVERNSDTSTKRGSISFRTMVRGEDNPSPPSGLEETDSLSSRRLVNTGSPSALPISVIQPMMPLKEVLSH